MTVIGVSWTTNNSSPTLTRIGIGGTNATYTGPASAGAAFDAWSGGPWSGMQRCNVWDDGSKTSNWGTRCFTDTDVSTLGQAMVEIPQFLYFIDTSAGNTIKFYIGLPGDAGTQIYTSGGWGGYHTLSSSTETSTDWWGNESTTPSDVHPLFLVDDTPTANAYVGAFEGYYNTDSSLLESKAGVTPTAIPSDTIARTVAESRGTGWEFTTIQSLSALQLLYIVEYASLNSQASVGNGLVSTTLQNTGATGSTGTDRGNATYGVTANNTTAMSYRGIENLWGNIQTSVEGLNIDASQNVWIAPQSRTRPAYYAWSTLVAPYVQYGTILNGGAGSYLKAINTDPDWTFLPTTGGGSSTTYFCDEIFEAATGNNVLFNGGGIADTTTAGIFAQRYVVVDTVATNGARIQYLPSV